MTLPKSLYEGLKFFIKLCPTLVTIVSGLLIKFNVADNKIGIITFIIGAVGTIVTVFVEWCKSNHYKTIANDGTTEELTEDTEEQ